MCNNVVRRTLNLSGGNMTDALLTTALKSNRWSGILTAALKRNRWRTIVTAALKNNRWEVIPFLRTVTASSGRNAFSFA